jgi:hypothetical protein
VSSATPAQVRAINVRFWYLGFQQRSDRPARLAACAALLGLDHGLASTKDLTQAQASQLLDVLAHASPRPAPPPRARGDTRAPGQATAAAAPVGGKMTEAQLNKEIRALCTSLGLYAFSATTWRIPGASAREGSSRGFPDWTIVGGGGFLFREAKSADGRRSMAQIRWGKKITQAGGDYAVWRPADWDNGTVTRELEALR